MASPSFVELHTRFTLLPSNAIIPLLIYVIIGEPTIKPVAKVNRQLHTYVYNYLTTKLNVTHSKKSEISGTFPRSVQYNSITIQN